MLHPANMAIAGLERVMLRGPRIPDGVMAATMRNKRGRSAGTASLAGWTKRLNRGRLLKMSCRF
jgi:hypothetical protein